MKHLPDAIQIKNCKIENYNCMSLKKKFITSIIALIILSAAMPVFAQYGQYGLDETAKAANLSTEGRNLPTVIGRIINIALGILGVLFLCLLLYAGWLWMTAMGDTKKTQTAKDLIIAAISGIVVIVLAYAISNFVLTSLSGIGNSETEETD